jgi:hypothetical protein
MVLSELKPVPDGRSPAPADARADYAKHIALSSKRLDGAFMKAVFERHKDVEGGLSKAALMAALREVDAPVLSSSDGASEDSLFRRADTSSSKYVDLDECASFALLHVCVLMCVAPAVTPWRAGFCWWPTCPTTSKCSSPITNWA